jgi:prolyl-tRNA synthetase
VRAKKSFDERVVECATLSEAKTAVKKGIARVNWCGDEQCGLKMEEGTGADVLGELVQTKKGKCPVCGKKTDTVVLMARTY